MQNYLRLFAQNREWANAMRAADAGFFERRSVTQEPHYLFIGCCDSRVPAELLTGAHPGEIFVHRNIANQADPTDMNMLSALEYAVEVLDVKHVLVCGHYQCGGVRAAMEPQGHRLVDHWLQVVRDLQMRHEAELNALADDGARFNRLVELNVLEQVFQLSRTPIVRHAWKKGKRPILHGLVYDVHDGLLKELVSGVDGEEHARELRAAVSGDFVHVPPSLHLAP
jgi:carbonic anhydrase